MQNKILLLIVVVLSGILVIVSSKNVTTFFNSKANVITIKNDDESIDKLNIEDYIVGVVASEMPASFEIEALKAQAVAARTYAFYKMGTSDCDYDVVTNVSNQGYITIEKMEEKWGSDFLKYYEKVKNAVDDTKGEVMTYNGEVIEAYYFAMSNGYTEDASLVFSEQRDYLQSVPSVYDNDTLKNFTVESTFTKNEVCTKLGVSCSNIIFSNIKRSDTNRVNEIDVNGTTFKGTNFRKLLNLRSTDFTIREDGDNIIITTKGYGHGVGMSQYGANGLAKNGKNYEEILKYYYKNVKISSI